MRFLNNRLGKKIVVKMVAFVMCMIVAAGVVVTANTQNVNAKAKNVSGKEVVAYAKRFVGNPYRWGGTSLTRGADCSGFTRSVFKKYGYSLPHSSAAQAKKGKKVSWANKQPGDIICYYGHVAIYMGNNKIVHAASRRSGIKISNNAGYRKVRCVRRILK